MRRRNALELPAQDADGNYPAVDYARASLARNIIRKRVEAGLTQRELAKLACIRHETLCRIESGKHTPSMASVTRLERALPHILGHEGFELPSDLNDIHAAQ